MDKDNPRRLYPWLFTKEERAPMGFIPTFFAIILISTVVGVFLVPIISKLIQ